MAYIQNYLEQFHEKIRMDYELNSILAEKRDIILNRIRDYLKDKGKPSFQEMLQGSYIMKTGVKPIENLGYDIDVALRLSINENDYTASEVRGWIYDAVKDHTEKVVSKGPCIRVIYKDGYHVDLVTYAVHENIFKETVFKLAHKQNGWKDANPQGLLDYVDNIMTQFKDTEDSATKTNQFRRLVRYIRRWDDESLPIESGAKPSGLAYILLVNNLLNSKVINDNKSDDLSALIQICNGAGLISGRISIKKPTPEYEDVFGKINNDDMDGLKNRLKALAVILEQVDAESDEIKACQLMKKHFGRDFPIPEAKKSNSFETIGSFLRNSLEKTKSIFAVSHRKQPKWSVNIEGRANITASYICKGFRPQQFQSDGDPLPKKCSLQFKADTNVSWPYEVYWQVVNTGDEAELANSLRGDFYDGEYERAGRFVRKESTLYKGKHWVECFVVKDGICLARSGEFV